MRYFFKPGSTVPEIHKGAQPAEEWPVGTYLYNSISGRHWIRPETKVNANGAFYTEWEPIEPSAFPAELKAIILLLT